jgi:hypothetical protein
MADKSAAPRILRWGVLTLATLLAILLLAALGPKLVSVLRGTAPPLPIGREWEGRVMIAMFATFMAGYAVGWWRPLWGGLLIILAACIVSIPLALQRNYGSLIFGIPLLVIGVLYVVRYRIDNRMAVDHDQRHSD